MNFYELDKNKSYLIITVGPSGSGKSTWVNSILQNDNEDFKFIRICPDEIRKEMTGNISDQSKNAEVWKEAFSRIKEFSKAGFSIIFDSTACNTKTIKQIEMNVNRNHIILYKIFKVSPDVAKERVAKDLASGVDRSRVPEDIIDKQYVGFSNSLKFIEESGRLILE
jgi:predicted ABC-type ATPase